MTLIKPLVLRDVDAILSKVCHRQSEDTIAQINI